MRVLVKRIKQLTKNACKGLVIKFIEINCRWLAPKSDLTFNEMGA